MSGDLGILNAAQAAAYLGTHVETVRRLARRGEIPAFKVGTDWRFDTDALRRWSGGQAVSTEPLDVLVVDDDPLMVRTLCRVVTWVGCRPRAAGNGGEALALIAERRPDLIFLDLVMPGMTGPDVLDRIRPDHPDLPVVIVTGYPNSDLVHQAAQQPPVMLIVKPVSADQIETTMRAVLGDRLPARSG